MGIISRIAHILPTKIILSLYYSLIYPYISYCNIVWASTYRSRLQRIIILQKRICRIIMGLPYLSHTDQLLFQLGILTIKQITQLQISLFMYRYKYNLLPELFKNYFHLASDFHSHFTRNSWMYRSEFARTNSRKFAIKSIGPSVWNRLPLSLRNITSYLSFKKQAKSFFMSH